MPDESAAAGTVFPPQVHGGEHFRPDGPECAYLAYGACTKCGGVAPLPEKWAQEDYDGPQPRPDVEYKQVSDADAGISGEKAV